MKYKVFLSINGSGENGGGMTSFYTKAQAVQACDQWRQVSSTCFAFLWDGSTWIQYSPIP